MHTGSFTATKKVRIIPKFDIGVPDILPDRIHEEIVLELNRKEVIRALNYADVYEVLEDNSEILLDKENFNDDNSDEALGSATDPIIPDEGMEGLVTHDVTGFETGGYDLARFYE